MKTLLDYIRLLLLSSGGMLVACSVLIVITEQESGTIMGERDWLHLSMLLFAGSVLFATVTRKGRISYKPNLSDWLMFTLVALVLFFYSWQIDTAPDKLTVIFILSSLWFLLRISLSIYPVLSMFFLFVFIYIGIIESFWGIGQLSGILYSDSINCKLTGSFLDTEPYAGYLAIVLPLCLSRLIHYRNCNKKRWWSIRTFLFYISLLGFFLVTIVLLSTQNHLVWIAAVISSLWIVWIKFSIWRKIRIAWQVPHKRLIPVMVFASVLLIGFLVILYSIQDENTKKRVFVWKVASTVIRENLIAGSGLGEFSDIYADAQEQYVQTALQGDVDEVLLQNPFYAYNEFLQILLEHGIVGLVLLIMLFGYGLYQGIKNNQIGASGGIISLIVLAFISFPLQMPSILILMIFLLCICQVNANVIQTKQELINISLVGDPDGKPLKNMITIVFILLISTSVYILFITHRNMSDSISQRWQSNRIIKNRTIDKANYIRRFSHYPSYLCEYAQYLHEACLYKESNLLLVKALEFSSNPLLYILMAKNYIGEKDFYQAEQYLLKSVELRSNKLLPYYMLAKLYSNPDFYQPEKMREMAEKVLCKNQILYAKFNNSIEKEMRSLLK